LEGKITIKSPGISTFRKKIKVRSDGKPKEFEANNDFRWMGDKRLKLEARAEPPDSLAIEVRPDGQPITFNFSSISQVGQEKYARGRDVAGKFTGWRCFFKASKL
jgi:hypothetical protein